MDIWWIIAAFTAGLGARLLRLPPLVGYLVAGMALAGFGVEGGALLSRLGDVGVGLLLFTVGLDLRLGSLLRPEVLGAGGLHLLAVTLAAAAGGLALGLPPLGALAIGVALSVSSLILAAKTLEARHDLGAYHGRVAIGILLLQTVVAAVMMGFLGDRAPSPWAALLLLLPALSPLLRRVLGWAGSRDLVLLFGLLLALGGLLGFEALGMSGELGALVAGALLAGHERTEDLRDVLWGLKEAFLAAFFLEVGLAGFPPASALLVVLALIAFLAVKAGLFFGLLVAFRLRARTAFMTALPLMSYSGFSLVVGAMALDAGLVPEETLGVLALATAASYLINAAAGRLITPLWRRLREALVRFERDVKHPDATPQTLGHSQFLVVGMGRIGTAAYEFLTEDLYCTAGLDVDPGRLAKHRAARRRVLYGDARDTGLWEDLDLSRLEAIVLAIPGPDARLDATRALRAVGYDGPITALTSDRREREALLEAGASAVYLSLVQTGRALARHAATDRRNADPKRLDLNVEVQG